MSIPTIRRCAIYTRKSSENGLEQSFNSLHAQREACEAYIKSQAHEGWTLRPTQYDDGGISGGHVNRPALQALLNDIEHNLVDVVLVYKVDRLSRSLADFAQLIQSFDEHNVSFVSITQQFNTSSSMGRLTLNVLLSFAQFEREVTSERIRDKIAASKRKGMWMGGNVPLGYDVKDKKLLVNELEAETVRHICKRYLALGCVRKLKEELDLKGYISKIRVNGQGGNLFSRGALYTLLRNPLYIGKVHHKGKVFDGEHNGIVDSETWNKVQAQLKANRSKAKHRNNAKVPSLLAGLLFDDQGYPMSPTHTTKGECRYRYYISQAVLKYEGKQSGSLIRVPAKGIEDGVLKQINEFLCEPHELMEAFINHQLRAGDQHILIAQAKKLAASLSEEPTHELIRKINVLIQRVELSNSELTIYLNTVGVLKLLPPGAIDIEADALNSETVVRRLPISLKRCGMEAKLILGKKDNQHAAPNTVKAIQKAVYKALEWSDALLSGKAKTLTELAKKEGVTQRYLSSLIHLAFLTPDIVEAISKGNVPPDMSLETLKRGFSLDWKKQRQLLGF